MIGQTISHYRIVFDFLVLGFAFVDGAAVRR
jgi:hypothetical protein